MRRVIHVLDSTLCDGFSSAGLEIDPSDKLKIAQHLTMAGVDVIEAGYPASSATELGTVSSIAQELDGIVVAARARVQRDEIDRAWQALQYADRPRIKLVIPTSPMFLQYTLRVNEEAVCRQTMDAVIYARSLGAQVQVTAEDATRSDWHFLSHFFSGAIAAGAEVISVQDSIGRMTPKECYDLVRHLRATVDGIHQAALSMDCRHELGMALSNALGATECGVQQVECTIGGIGFPLGRVPLEGFVTALNSREDRYHAVTNIRPANLHKLTSLFPSGPSLPAAAGRVLRDVAAATIPEPALLSLDTAPGTESPSYTLDSFRVIVSDDGNCRAEVALIGRNRAELAGTAEGSNQPEALHRAINQALGFRGLLVEHMVSHTAPDQKDVVVCIEDRGEVTTGHGSARTVLQASALAYLSALNGLTRNR